MTFPRSLLATCVTLFWLSMSATEGYFVYDTVIEGRPRYYASLLPRDTGFTSGLPAEAIAGEFTGVRTPEVFRQNPYFIQFMARAIERHAPSSRALTAEAQRQQNGFVYILDKRTPTPDGRVPPEDIIGAFAIEAGEMISFSTSPNYRVPTATGFMQLDPCLKDRLVEDLVAIATTSSGGSTSSERLQEDARADEL